MLNSHQTYLEAPYASRDADLAMLEYWEDNIAPETYERLDKLGEVNGHENDAEEFIAQPFHEWLDSRQAEREFTWWLDDQRR
jgi:hypothetical protein